MVNQITFDKFKLVEQFSEDTDAYVSVTANKSEWQELLTHLYPGETFLYRTGWLNELEAFTETGYVGAFYIEDYNAYAYLTPSKDYTYVS